MASSPSTPTITGPASRPSISASQSYQQNVPMSGEVGFCDFMKLGILFGGGVVLNLPSAFTSMDGVVEDFHHRERVCNRFCHFPIDTDVDFNMGIETPGRTVKLEMFTDKCIEMLFDSVVKGKGLRSAPVFDQERADHLHRLSMLESSDVSPIGVKLAAGVFLGDHLRVEESLWDIRALYDIKEALMQPFDFTKVQARNNLEQSYRGANSDVLEKGKPTVHEVMQKLYMYEHRFGRDAVDRLYSVLENCKTENVKRSHTAFRLVEDIQCSLIHFDQLCRLLSRLQKLLKDLPEVEAKTQSRSCGVHDVSLPAKKLICATVRKCLTTPFSMKEGEQEALQLQRLLYNNHVPKEVAHFVQAGIAGDYEKLNEIVYGVRCIGTDWIPEAGQVVDRLCDGMASKEEIAVLLKEMQDRRSEDEFGRLIDYLITVLTRWISEPTEYTRKLSGVLRNKDRLRSAFEALTPYLKYKSCIKRIANYVPKCDVAACVADICKILKEEQWTESVFASVSIRQNFDSAFSNQSMRVNAMETSTSSSSCCTAVTSMSSITRRNLNFSGGGKEPQD